MIIGKKEQERLEREQCAQISLLCRQKLMGYAESFEELGKSFRQEIHLQERTGRIFWKNVCCGRADRSWETICRKWPGSWNG